MMAMTAAQAVGSLIQGQQQADAYAAKAREREYQAAQAEADAQAEREAAQVRADKIRKAGKMQGSQARGALAKSGVVADFGTAQTIQDYIARSSESDALTEILTGKYAAAKTDIGAATTRREAGYLNTASDNAMFNGILGAGQSILGGYAKTSLLQQSPGWKVQQP